MNETSIARILLLLIAACQVRAQLPASGNLSDSDWKQFQTYLAGVKKRTVFASDPDTMIYETARTWAAAKQWPETMQGLKKVVDLKAGLDPVRDSIFGELRGTKEFAEIAAAVRAATPPVLRSQAYFRISEGDLMPESVAYDSKSKQFYFGSRTKGKVFSCTASGGCSEFVRGLGMVCGLRVHGTALWLLNNSDTEAALLEYDLAQRRLVQKCSIARPGHEFNDLVIASNGDVYLTDTPAGVVWRLVRGANALTQLSGKFELANGIALSPDGVLLYVSTFGDGISVVHLKTNGIAPVAHPSDLCLATIDGLYFHHGELIAIQNAFMSPRVVRLVLKPDLRGIERFEVLERRNPLFDGITNGVIVGGDFFYMANIQDEKKRDFDPITILRLRL